LLGCDLTGRASYTTTIAWTRCAPTFDRVIRAARLMQTHKVESINEPREFNTLKDDLIDHLYRKSSLKLLYSPALRAYSQPKENERDFRMRLSQTTREKRDEEVDSLNQRYEIRLRTLQDRLRRAQSTVG